MRDTIEMAREAGLFTHKEVQAELKAFEALVRADERKQARSAQQEPVGVFVEDDDIGHVRLNPHLQLKLKDGDKLYTASPAQPAVPDAITDNSESPDYIQGFNDCRELTIQMRKS